MSVLLQDTLLVWCNASTPFEDQHQHVQPIGTIDHRKTSPYAVKSVSLLTGTFLQRLSVDSRHDTVSVPLGLLMIGNG